MQEVEDTSDSQSGLAGWNPGEMKEAMEEPRGCHKRESARKTIHGREVTSRWVYDGDRAEQRELLSCKVVREGSYTDGAPAWHVSRRTTGLRWQWTRFKIFSWEDQLCKWHGDVRAEYTRENKGDKRRTIDIYCSFHPSLPHSGSCRKKKT